MRPAIVAALVSSLCFAAEVKLGKPLTLDEPMQVSQVLAKANGLTGKTVQVKGKVTEVCQMMGCWMALVEPGTQSMLRIKVNDGDIVFPKESVGRMAVAEGELIKMTLSKEQAVAMAKHEAEEQGRKFNPSSVKGPKVIYQIAGTGAVLSE
ncbi:MAG: DUF4920 domain-containing protein [Acidobacteriota bacterium]